MQKQTLVYNPAALWYEVPISEREHKSLLIADINTIQVYLNKGCVDEKQFEQLMQLPVSDLRKMIDDQAEALARAQQKN